MSNWKRKERSVIFSNYQSSKLNFSGKDVEVFDAKKSLTYLLFDNIYQKFTQTVWLIRIF